MVLYQILCIGLPTYMTLDSIIPVPTRAPYWVFDEFGSLPNIGSLGDTSSTPARLLVNDQSIWEECSAAVSTLC